MLIVVIQEMRKYRVKLYLTSVSQVRFRAHYYKGFNRKENILNFDI